VLAVTFAALGVGFGTGRHPPRAAIAGLILGLISLVLAGWFYLSLF